jgi:WD40 repeat protein
MGNSATTQPAFIAVRNREIILLDKELHEVYHKTVYEVKETRHRVCVLNDDLVIRYSADEVVPLQLFDLNKKKLTTLSIKSIVAQRVNSNEMLCFSEGKYIVYNVRTRRVIMEVEARSLTAQVLDDDRFIVDTHEGLEVYDITTRSKTNTLPYANVFKILVVSPDVVCVVTGTELFVLNVVNSAVLLSEKKQPFMEYVMMGKYIAGLAYTRSPEQQYDKITYDTTRNFKCAVYNDNSVECMKLSDNKVMYIDGSNDRNLILWDIQSDHHLYMRESFQEMYEVFVCDETHFYIKGHTWGGDVKDIFECYMYSYTNNTFSQKLMYDHISLLDVFHGQRKKHMALFQARIFSDYHFNDVVFTLASY